jgi:hypothetical protein
MQKIKTNNNTRRIRTRKINKQAIHCRATNFLRGSDSQKIKIKK